MTKITFFRQNGIFWGFQETGHTGFGEEGDDILCSAISAMTMLILNTIEVAYKISTEYTIDDVIAVAVDEQGTRRNVTMTQFWPVKIPISAYAEKLLPQETMITQQRIIDTFFPVAVGGTYCIEAGVLSCEIFIPTVLTLLFNDARVRFRVWKLKANESRKERRVSLSSDCIFAPLSLAWSLKGLFC